MLKMEEQISCECNVLHEETVAVVCASLPADEVVMDLADAFKAFSDFTRLKILLALLNSELCVCDIAAVLGMTKSAVSHQLKTLKQHNLVKNRRDGKVIYYSIADAHVETMISNGMDHVLE